MEKVLPVKGAATYEGGFDSESGSYGVFMTDDEGYTSVIESAKTQESADMKANKWQKKENKAVLKSQGKI